MADMRYYKSYKLLYDYMMRIIKKPDNKGKKFNTTLLFFSLPDKILVSKKTFLELLDSLEKENYIKFIDNKEKFEVVNNGYKNN